MTIKLGQRVRDIVSGFTGIATAKCEYLNGCVQYCVKPPCKDNKQEDGMYIDHQQLEVVDDGILSQIAPKETGGPAADTPRDRYAG